MFDHHSIKSVIQLRFTEDSKIQCLFSQKIFLHFHFRLGYKHKITGKPDILTIRTRLGAGYYFLRKG